MSCKQKPDLSSHSGESNKSKFTGPSRKGWFVPLRTVQQQCYQFLLSISKPSPKRPQSIYYGDCSLGKRKYLHLSGMTRNWL